MPATISAQTIAPLARPALAAAKTALREVGRTQTQCSGCGLREQCLARGLEAEEMRYFDALVARRTKLRRGETLFRAGERFTALHAIHSGSCKTVLAGADGHDQVAGYHMMGDVLGIDGIGSGVHDCEAVALEDMEICRMPFDRVEDLAQRRPQIQRSLNRMMSREIARERRVTFILGSMHADQRLAAFLLDLAQRYHDRGYSSVEFVLRMTREEIGSYLGLKLETVSRLFSRFHAEGLIHVNGRVVKLLDRASLKAIMGCEAP